MLMPPFFTANARIHLVECHQPSEFRLEALVVADGCRQRIWFETDAAPLPKRADAFLPLLVPAAMASGLPLQFDAPLSAEVITAAHRVAAVLASWFPDWEELRLQVGGPVVREPLVQEPGRIGAGGQAVFFSGGVDSFRALQILRDQVQHLIFVHGLDIALEDRSKADAVTAHIAAVAAETGTSLLKVRSNLREFTDRWVRWDLHQNGSALAAVALLLMARLDRVWIPSTRPLAFLHPFGSHPGLETLWSLSGLRLQHDSVDEDRLDKLKELANWPLARRQVRVCWQPRTPGLNCGRCYKCLTTQALLRGFCSHVDWPTFPAQFDLQALERLQPKRHPAWSVEIWRFLVLRDHLAQTGQDPQLQACLTRLLRHQERRRPFRGMGTLAVRALSRLRSLKDRGKVGMLP